MKRISTACYHPLSLALIAILGFTGNAAATVKVPKINWGPCEYTPQFTQPGNDYRERVNPNAQCAKVEVPLDYDKPNGPTTTIALSRLPAANQSEKIGSLFLNPGGPGGSGVNFALFANTSVDPAVLEKFDVIGWDPRGVYGPTGGSTPLSCWDNNNQANTYLGDNPVFPYLAEQEKPYFELTSGVADICFKRKQPIINHMSTADVARDLDLLRQAVGDTKLTYLGYSYGSHIGNTYANLFPDKVRALVIDGVLNPILWTGGWQILSDRTASVEVLNEFFRLCDSAGTNCAFSGGAANRFEKLRQRVLSAPIIIDTPIGQTVYVYDNFVGISANVMYRPDTWSSYASLLASLESVAAGDVSQGTRVYELYETLRQELTGKSSKAVDDFYDYPVEGFNGNHCSDAQYPFSSQPYSLISDFAERGSFQGPYWWWFNAICAKWPVAADRYTGPWTAKTSAPVLVVGNFFDPATDYAGAVASDRLLRKSRLLSYAGWGHTAAYSGRSQCVDDYVTSYLLDGSLPPKNTVCPAAPNPFLPATTASAKSASKPDFVPVIGRPVIPDLRPLRR